ncbi:Kelch repeat type 1 [Macleaya cordata]|uniref:Kelch repeat type 1 n=1 Tax=Macleaya cordata TaxID=56857 RepID=A0A200QVW8_MACCD|nr:Kelch repeat type 1 [Macleaya cordata]
MRWEKLNSRLRETQDGRKSPGRIGGTLGPGKRWGHTCNSIKGGRLLYVFGGYGKDNCQTNDVHVFDTARQTWSKPMVKGNPPSPRDSHSCTTVGNNLFVFGGTDGKVPLKDLHILDTSTNTWISPSLRGEGPEAREGHSAALIGKRLFIFGGCGKSPDHSAEVYYNDLYILDTETLVWRRAVTSGTPPSARDSHTCSSWKHKIIVIGGEDASDYYLSDVHILDTDSLIWKELSSACWILPARAGHSTVALGKHLFVFGGFTDDRNLYDDLNMLNLDTGNWTKLIAAGEGPSSRFSVAGDCLDLRKGVLVFIGGCNEHLEALDDMYYLHTEISIETEQDEQRQEKFSLKKELKRKCQEQYLPTGLPINDKDEPKLETTPKISRSMPLPFFGQAADKKNSTLLDFKPSNDKIFEAKVTEAFHYGYTIETNINGKPLRGVLFSYKPGFAHAANSYLSSFMTTTGEEARGEDGCKPKLKTADGQTDNYDGRKSASQEPLMETNIAFESNNSMPADLPQSHTINGNKSELSTESVPDSKDDGANEPSCSSRKVPCEDPTSAAKDTVASSPNQGINNSYYVRCTLILKIAPITDFPMNKHFRGPLTWCYSCSASDPRWWLIKLVLQTEHYQITWILTSKKHDCALAMFYCQNQLETDRNLPLFQEDDNVHPCIKEKQFRNELWAASDLFLPNKLKRLKMRCIIAYTGVVWSTHQPLTTLCPRLYDGGYCAPSYEVGEQK